MTAHKAIAGTAPPVAGYATARDTVARLIADEAFKPALTTLLRLCREFPSDPLLLDDMATCYWALGDADTAMKLTELVAGTLSTNARAWGKLGAMALSAGDAARARSAFEKSLALEPGQADALAALNRIDPFDRRGQRAARLRKIARSAKSSAADKATALNALGRIEAAAGQTRAAMFNFGKSKALSPGKFDAEAVARHVRAQAERFERVEPRPGAAQADDGARVVFVVGLPRSGTTLIEHILLRHPRVGTIGESTALQDVLTACRAQVARAHGASGAWDWVDHLTPAHAAELRTRYLQRCAARFAGGLPEVILDKTPFNVFELGFARRILPSARFVFLSRHPLDVGLSAFSTNFFAAHAYSRTLASIGAMSRAVYGSVDDYEDKLGSCLRRQSYKALVCDPEAQIRALLTHLDLDWTPACLTPEQHSGIARTASVMQVRAPIGPQALDRWRRYERELAPLIEALGGWTWIDAWSAADAAAAG